MTTLFPSHWPVLPMRHLRALIAAALRDTAVCLGRLFAAPTSTWEGSPPSLGETVTRGAICSTTPATCSPRSRRSCL